MFDGDEPSEATLTFRAQADGRKVSRLPGGKVVLIDLIDIDKVRDGERWKVTLTHRDTFAIARPVERAAAAPTVLAPAPKPGPSQPPPATPARAAASASATLAAPATAGVAKPKPHEKPTLFLIQGAIVEPMHVVREASERVALFVDGANMDGARRHTGYFIDYLKARDYFLGDGSFYAAFYYIADFTATDPLQLKFMDALSHAGFIIRRKPAKVMEDEETGERFVKANLDTEIVLDMLNTVDNWDVAFLFSGDSDFERAVELLRSRGKRVYVVSSRRTVSRELAYVADKPVFHLEDFRGQLEKLNPAS